MLSSMMKSSAMKSLTTFHSLISHCQLQVRFKTPPPVGFMYSCRHFQTCSVGLDLRFAADFQQSVLTINCLIILDGGLEKIINSLINSTRALTEVIVAAGSLTFSRTDTTEWLHLQAASSTTNNVQLHTDICWTKGETAGYLQSLKYGVWKRDLSCLVATVREKVTYVECGYIPYIFSGVSYWLLILQKDAKSKIGKHHQSPSVESKTHQQNYTWMSL